MHVFFFVSFAFCLLFVEQPKHTTSHTPLAHMHMQNKQNQLCLQTRTWETTKCAANKARCNIVGNIKHWQMTLFTSNLLEANTSSKTKHTSTTRPLFGTFYVPLCDTAHTKPSALPSSNTCLWSAGSSSHSSSIASPFSVASSSLPALWCRLFESQRHTQRGAVCIVLLCAVARHKRECTEEVVECAPVSAVGEAPAPLDPERRCLSPVLVAARCWSFVEGGRISCAGTWRRRRA